MKITLPFLILFILAFVPIRAEINPIEDIFPQHPAHIVSGNIFKIFPNPVKEYFYVSDNGDVAYIFLYNIMGKKVREFTKAPPDVSYIVSDVPIGVYHVQLVNRNGEVLYTQRIQKQ